MSRGVETSDAANFLCLLASQDHFDALLHDTLLRSLNDNLLNASACLHDIACLGFVFRIPNVHTSMLAASVAQNFSPVDRTCSVLLCSILLQHGLFSA
jgi:hypothetical protein